MEKKSISKDLLFKIIVIAAAAVIAVTGVTLWLTLYRPFDDSYKTVTIQIVDEENGYDKTFNVRTNASSLADLIKDKEEWGILYTEDLVFGMFFTGVNDTEAPIGYWVSVLSSDENYYDTSSSYNTEYTAKNGILCITTTVGASFLPLIHGEIYVIIVIPY